MTLHEDEGVVSMWGLQVLAGHLPYRDFVVYLSPLLAYLYGGAFWLFGSSVLVERLLDAVPIVGGAALLGLVGRAVLPASWAAAVALLWGVWLTAFLGYGPYHFWGPALVLAMTVALLGPAPRPALAGAAAAGGLLFDQAVLPAVAAGLLVAYLLNRSAGDAARFSAAPLGAGAVLTVALAATGSLASFFDQTVGFTLGRYQRFNHLPFPWNPVLLADTLNWHSGPAAYWEFGMFWLLGVVVPVLIAAWTLLLLARRPAGLSPAAVLGLISTGLFLSVFLARFGGPVCWMAAPLALVLAALRLHRMLGEAGHGQARRLALSPVLVLLLAGLTPAPVGFWLSCSSNPGGPLAAVGSTAGSICLRRPEADELRHVEQLLAGRPADGVAFLPTSPGLYLLTGSIPATPSYWVLRDQIRPSELAWEEAAMTRSAALVVYVADPDLDTGHPWAFDEFLTSNYVEAEGYPGIRVLRRP